MKGLAALTVLCGFGSMASAWSIFGGVTALNSVGAMTSEATNQAGPSDIAAPRFCVSNLSKNGCEGVVEPGFYEFAGCSDVNACRSIRVTDAVYRVTLKSSGLACGITCETLCDEFPDGTLTLKFDYLLRAGSCCPYRGSWDGEWELVTDGGRVFAGTAHGTIGVGTNRQSDCNVTHDSCENCYDVALQGDEWIVGIEGSFRGASVLSTIPAADELNFTCDGTWVASALANRPFGEPFRVFNRFDGAFIDYCP